MIRYVVYNVPATTCVTSVGRGVLVGNQCAEAEYSDGMCDNTEFPRHGSKFPFFGQNFPS